MIVDDELPDAENSATKEDAVEVDAAVVVAVVEVVVGSGGGSGACQKNDGPNTQLTADRSTMTLNTFLDLGIAQM